MKIDSSNQHQIIFPGQVITNQDPAMLGRLRVKPKTEEYTAILNSVPPDKINTDKTDLIEEAKWTQIDPFLFLPLIPYFISQIPKDDEYVHIIYMNKQYQNKSQFYIQGPFADPRAASEQSFDASQTFLATGDLTKLYDSIKNEGGSFKTGTSNGIFPEPGDNAILGRGFNDIIFKTRNDGTSKEDSVLVRAGKTKKLDPSEFPIGNDNRSFLQLSYFGQEKVSGAKRKQTRFEENVKFVKKMIIWDIINLESKNNFTGSVGLYKVTENPKFNSKNFQADTILNMSVGSDYTAPLEEIKFVGKSFEETSNLINKFIEGIFKNNLTNIPDYAVKNLTNFAPDQTFPFVVTPSKNTYTAGIKFAPAKDSDDIKELVNYAKFYNKIKLNPGLTNSGWFLVWENKNNAAVIGPQADVKIDEVTDTSFVDSDISYAVLGSQKIYLLSQMSEGPKGKVDLRGTLYGIGQDKFVGDEKSIQNTTYPTVRGDQLMILLQKIFSFVTGHVHPIATLPPVPVASGNGQTSAEIDSILANSENTILNQEIRIN